MAAILVLGTVLEAGMLARRGLHLRHQVAHHSRSASVYRGFRDPGSLYNVCDELTGPGPALPIIAQPVSKVSNAFMTN